MERQLMENNDSRGARSRLPLTDVPKSTRSKMEEGGWNSDLAKSPNLRHQSEVRGAWEEAGDMQIVPNEGGGRRNKISALRIRRNGAHRGRGGVPGENDRWIRQTRRYDFPKQSRPCGRGLIPGVMQGPYPILYSDALDGVNKGFESFRGGLQTELRRVMGI